MLKINKTGWGLILIFLVALAFRTYKLSDFPYGFHFDEANAAWNSLSILETGKDDQGNFLPWYYNSFGDFRPTGLFYLIMPFLVIFGETVMAVRIAAAVFGALTIFPLYLLAKELTKSETKSKLVPICTAFLLAVNPWHINVSRATSEVAVSLFLAVFGLYFLIRTIKYNSKISAIASFFLFLISFWFYHSIRVLAPALAVITIGYYYVLNKKKLKINWSWLVALGLILATILVMGSSQARGRLGQVLIKNDAKVDKELIQMPVEEGQNNVLVARIFHNKVAVLGRRFAEEYSSYFGTDFLIGRAAKPIRYITTNNGLLTYVEYVFLILGLMAIAGKPESRMVILWLLLAPIPAAVTNEDVPNLHRSMLMVPFLMIIEGFGLGLILKAKSKILKIIVLVLLGLNLIYYLHFYYSHGNFALSVYYRDGGMIEMAKEVGKIQNNYDLIVLTNYGENPYPWIAFFNNMDPKDFNKNRKSLGDGSSQYRNLLFSNQHCPSETAFKKYDVKRLLVVDGEGCGLPPEQVKTYGITNQFNILRKDNSPPFVMRERVR